MRILLLSNGQVCPFYDGATLRYYHFLQELCVRHEITLLQQTQNEESRFPLGPFGEENAVSPVTLQSSCKRVFSVKRLDEYKYLRWGTLYESFETRSRLARLLEDESYDVIWGGSDDWAYYVPPQQKRRLLLDVQDCKNLAYRRNLFSAPSALKKLRIAGRWGLYRLYARRYLTDSPYFCVAASADATSLKTFLPHAQVFLSPNGVDVDSFQAGYDMPGWDGFPSAVFVGTLGASQNMDAVRFFAHKVHPLISARVPDFRFVVVGRDPSPELVAELRSVPGVEVAGTVPDVRPYLWQAGVALAPMVSGQGIKNKILEAWAAGCPVVATSMGAETVLARNGCNLLVADDPKRLADAVISVLQDPTLRASLATNGRRTVEEHYNWAAQARILEGIFEQIARKE